ncbi:universal stress protein [Lyngbya confervoides]|uniref:Universal stress protein n=1 Tax=Lyngbya confervoides BDU141951 TaxID=1574623 RepID=A0ABD4T1M9_9CYAN|nr:universal stress protein [Lyngbya confervoides]MCM1982671.1 universal stress protein [Lyngbya confervoides BDU141951]
MFKTVLFPIDHSRTSQDVADKVAELVKFCQGRLVVMTVSKSAEDSANENAVPEAIAEQLLASASEIFAKWDLEIETIHRHGKPAFCICDVADELAVDLIIMGCRGVGLSEDHGEKSVSTRVINLAPCPVLVIP